MQVNYNQLKMKAEMFSVTEEHTMKTQTHGFPNFCPRTMVMGILPTNTDTTFRILFKVLGFKFS